MPSDRFALKGENAKMVHRGEIGHGKHLTFFVGHENGHPAERLVVNTLVAISRLACP